MTRENELARAIEAADMPPREYRIFGALLRQAARWKTAEILDRFQPSLADLARMSKMSRQTLLDGLGHLEKHGWVTRTRSTGGRGHKTAYQLQAGVSCNCGKQERPRPKTEAERARRHRQKKKWLAECEEFGRRTTAELSSESVTAEPETVQIPRDETVQILDQNCLASRDDSPGQGHFRTKEGSDVGERGEKGLKTRDPVREWAESFSFPDSWSSWPEGTIGEAMNRSTGTSCSRAA